jgi:TRAP-type mannitol/chloroaromatic compound transport system permease small subunit
MLLIEIHFMEAFEMNVWIRLSKTIDLCIRWTGLVCSYLLVPLTLLVVYEVISRSLKHPTIWTFEMSIFFYGAHFMLVAAYGLLCKSHVSIDLVSSRFSKRTNAVLSLICYLLMYFPFIFVLTYFGVSYSVNSWSMLETSWSIWGPPLYPIKTVIPLTAIMLLLQGISEVIKNIDILVRERSAK